jgi:hypothetical protein
MVIVVRGKMTNNNNNSGNDLKVVEVSLVYGENDNIYDR